MSSSWLTKLVLALAFTVLPLQALAETIQVFLCHSPSAATEMAGEHRLHSETGHDHGDASQTTAHGWHADAYDDSAAGHGDHFCCDAVAAALPLFAKQLTQQKFSSIAVALQVRHDSTFLKLPQRPPLA